MKIQNHITSVLVAVVCSLGPLTPLTSNAASDLQIVSPGIRLESMMYCEPDGSYSGASRYELTEGPNGTAILTGGKEKAYSILVISDGAMLDEYALSSSEANKQNAVFNSVHEIDATYEGVMSFLDSETGKKVSRYGESVRFYQFSHDTHNSQPDTVNREIRRMMLDNPHILDAIIYTEQLSFNARFSGDIIAHPGLLSATDSDRYEELHSQHEEELKMILSESRLLRTDWDADVAAWMNDHDTLRMTETEILNAMQNDGVQSDYELMRKGYALAENFEKTSEGVFEGAQAGFVTAGKLHVTLSGDSCWDGIGNADDDPVINASDASRILISAAESGAGLPETLTSTQQLSADVNADGVVNSSDAALVLQYAAATGSGQDVKIIDFVK